MSRLLRVLLLYAKHAVVRALGRQGVELVSQRCCAHLVPLGAGVRRCLCVISSKLHETRAARSHIHVRTRLLVLRHPLGH